MKVLIVEDETAAYENLKSILMEIDHSIELLEHTESVVQTVRWLGSHPAPDLIFMDIHLSDGSAFNIFSSVMVETPVIFTTAYDEYAIDAFKVNSIDYLLKPIESEEIKRALEKFRKWNKQDVMDYLSQLSFLNPAGRYSERILIPVNNDLVPVNIQQVSYFYSSNGETRAVLKDQTVYHYSKALENIYNSLNPTCFFRANKQFIVSKDSIKNITIWFDKRLLVTLDIDVPERIYVSKNRAAQFKKWLTAG
ncbi:MAG: LytTR family DNA-binding domain-containing protein [Tannerella sp.]|jgi:DNA-binding LytR/AlgR family response regulator|nr:LytTR family DNA-binding domain-containing protein [Tannerella sp.]